MARISDKAIRVASFVKVAGVAMLFLCGAIARADDDSAKSVELRLEGSCDATNSRLWLVNNHDSKAIVAAVRWSLAGSKRVINDKFEVAAQARLEIGCAAKADIVSVQYVVH